MLKKRFLGSIISTLGIIITATAVHADEPDSNSVHSSGVVHFTTSHPIHLNQQAEKNAVNVVAVTPEMPAGVQAIPVLLAIGGMAFYQRKKKLV